MTLFTTRRRLAAAALAVLALSPTTAFGAGADGWPERPVRILVSFPPGGSSDLVARLLAERLSEALGQQFVVENRPGAGGTVAAEALRREAADGHTFMLSNLAPFTIAPTQFADISYDAVADFTHVTYIGAVHMGMFVSPLLGVETFAEFAEAARAEPGRFDYGSSGVGSWSHVIGQNVISQAQLDVEHIPYQGSNPMRLDFRAGVIPVFFDALLQNREMVEDGEAVAIAVSSAERLASMPEVPTFREHGVDLVAENWLGLTAPAGLDPMISDKLDAALAEIMATPAIVEQLDMWGLVREPMTSAEFAAFVADQIEVWRPMVTAAGAE
jgi:tripartite-type tricarboxylate transporter receptor subunit TctC